MQLFVNQLTNIDFSYLDAHRGMVGETWLASVILDGTLDDQGMICDFGTVKKVLRHWFDDQIDHRLLVPAHSPSLTLHSQTDDYIDLEWHYKNGTIRMKAPAEAISLVDAEQIDSATVAIWSQKQLQPLFDPRLKPLDISFEPEAISDAFYHYSHGLKKHDGNCQRIAHGHRSRIQIWLDEQRNSALEQIRADRWRDIYIGSREDLLTDETATQLEFAYTSAQGEFWLSIPASHCYLIDTDSTVELIAAHLASAIKQDYPDFNIRVRAFEGINKGAQVSA
jgi:6-pyruvoyl-tetrahydropterin synthase